MSEKGCANELLALFPFHQSCQARALGIHKMLVDLLRGHDLQRQIHQVGASRLAHSGNHFFLAWNMVRHLCFQEETSFLVLVFQVWGLALLLRFVYLLEEES